MYVRARGSDQSSLEEALSRRPASSAPMLGPPLELDESGLDR